MDRFAQMCVVFENAYCAAPASNASRAALLSDFRPSTTGIYGNAEFIRESKVVNNETTLPRYFSNHGYYATVRGKIFHTPMGSWADPQSWDSQENLDGKNLNVAAKFSSRQAMVCLYLLLLMADLQYWTGRVLMWTKSKSTIN